VPEHAIKISVLPQSTSALPSKIEGRLTPERAGTFPAIGAFVPAFNQKMDMVGHKAERQNFNVIGGSGTQKLLAQTVTDSSVGEILLSRERAHRDKHSIGADVGRIRQAGRASGRHAASISKPGSMSNESLG
jgi:hypothetical protein